MEYSVRSYYIPLFQSVINLLNLEARRNSQPERPFLPPRKVIPNIEWYTIKQLRDEL